jgi:hypothetical protein
MSRCGGWFTEDRKRIRSGRGLCHCHGGVFMTCYWWQERPSPYTHTHKTSRRLLLSDVVSHSTGLAGCKFTIRHAVCLLQGVRANEYPSDPSGALESWARARWPAAGQRLYQWSYQVSNLLS